jgi:hypothetical protein
LHRIVTPDCSDPATEQPGAHDCRHPHSIAALPQLFGTQSTSSAPPPLMMQTWPIAHVRDRQNTPVHGPVSTAHAPFAHVATVRPLPAQSS